ncbi:ornithine cyclodeaminase family protein [Litchfieldia alkalitelluris]|uniref:ornithine cyclodeaminase family protein n=1 Tax=Litchfieldia alkalitelluris TaxID=304268 RepID=UPI0009961D9D|nr:ornithine cyclodeaminase family protein [Litchfieldia alkalitelluris]
METTIISKKQIEKLLTMDAVIAAVEEAYGLFSAQKVTLAPVLSIDVEKHHGELDIKAGYEQVDDIISVKLASGFWNNPENYNLPSGLATIVLVDAKNGVPLAVMDGGLITDMRTGAAGAVSAKYLARPNSKRVAIFGTGMQARMQLLALSEILDIEEVYIWGRNEAKVASYVQEMEARVKATFYQGMSAEECTVNADIIITTTPSKTPLFEAEWVQPGTHVICIGTDMPGKQEVDPKLFEKAKIVVDSFIQCQERGEIQHALTSGLISEVYAEIGEIVLGEKQGRESNQEITVFDSTGLAIQDITTAKMILKLTNDRKDLIKVELI